MNASNANPLEFSRPFAIEDIAPGGSDVLLKATPDERRKLAERFGLLSLETLTARLTITRGASGIPVRVHGRLDAVLVQECVVSLEPVRSKINELLEVAFAPVGDEPMGDLLDPDQPDPPEPLDGDSVELGEIVAQYLSLAIDPYPKRAGAAPPDWQQASPHGGDESADNPFSILADLRKKLG